MTTTGANGNGFTPTQKRVIQVLSDGLGHHRDELQACLKDELSTKSLSAHIAYLRKKLRPIGEDIICTREGYASYYRHIRIVSPYTE